MEGKHTSWARILIVMAFAMGIVVVLPFVAFPHGKTWGPDLAFTAWVHQFASPTLTAGAKWISTVAYHNVHYWIAGVVGLYFLVRYGRVGPGLALLVARIGSDQAGTFLKDSFARPRPQLTWLAKQSSGFSYPSGSVTVGATFYIVLAYVIASEISNLRVRRAVQASGWIFAGLIALSRVYLGAHWLSDTIAGLGVALTFTAGLSYLLTLPVTQWSVLAPLQAAASDMRGQKNRKR